MLYRRALLDFDCESITLQVENVLKPYISNSLFHPKAIARVSSSASRASSWVLGMLEKHKWHAGRGHERLDRLAQFSFDKNTLNSLRKKSSDNKSIEIKINKRKSCSIHSLARGELNSKKTVSALSRVGVGLGESILSNLARSNTEISLQKTLAQQLPPLKDWSSAIAPPSHSHSARPSPLFFTRTVDLTPVEMQAVSPNYNPFTIRYVESQGLWRKKLAQQERFARLMTQRRQMERLAARPQDKLMNDHEMSSLATGSQGRQMFVCSDGVTSMPYEIIGDPSLEVRSHSFVVTHDLFDSLDTTKIFFQPLADQHSGCQILVYNYAGQAGTNFLSDGGGINPASHAQNLIDLLEHVNSCGDMLLSTSPFFLVGIGYGFNICAQFSAMSLVNSGTENIYKHTLRGLVSINGLPTIDAQYAAILYAALDAFKKFPKDRPDLPVSYLSRFQFSDAYLSLVHPHLALNIYTAVANPITLDGRVALIRGALNEKKSMHTFLEVPLPIIALQSTEDILVAPSNMEVLLSGRTVHHIWSHEAEPRDRGTHLGANGRAVLRDSLKHPRREAPYLGCAIWVRAGHEVRQEAANIVASVFEEITPIDVAEQQVSDEVSSLACFVKSPQEPNLREITQTTIRDEQMIHFAPGHSVDILFDDCKKPNVPVDSSPPHWTPPTPVDYESIVNASISSDHVSIRGSGRGDGTNKSEHRPGKLVNPATKICSTTAKASMPYAVLFALFASNLSPQDLTIKCRLAFSKEVSIRIGRIVGHLIKPTQVRIIAVHAGSLILNGKVDGLFNADVANTLATVLAAKNPILPVSWGRQILTIEAIVSTQLNPNEDNQSSLDYTSESKQSRGEDDPLNVDANDAISLVSSQQAMARNSVASGDQRRAGQYAEYVDSAQVIISNTGPSHDTISDATKLPRGQVERELVEMQRQVDVDAAEGDLVKEGIAPMYKPPFGIAAPVLHPPPTEYREQNMPAITNWNNLDDLFSPNINLKTSLRNESSKSAIDKKVKGEANSAQLIRKSQFCDLILERHDPLVRVARTR